MKKFASLATGAVVASMIVPVFATEQDQNSNDTTVNVNEQAIALISNDFDFGAGAPGAAMSDTAAFNVVTNAALGYTVKLDLSDLEKAGVRAAGDKIAASSIDGVASVVLAEEAVAPANEAYGNSPYGMDDNEILAGSDIRSLADGDDFSVELSFEMPWIETGTYAGSATWTADSL
jgi:hypothetical protein